MQKSKKRNLGIIASPPLLLLTDEWTLILEFFQDWKDLLAIASISKHFYNVVLEFAKRIVPAILEGEWTLPKALKQNKGLEIQNQNLPMIQQFLKTHMTLPSRNLVFGGKYCNPLQTVGYQVKSVPPFDNNSSLTVVQVTEPAEGQSSDADFNPMIVSGARMMPAGYLAKSLEFKKGCLNTFRGIVKVLSCLHQIERIDIVFDTRTASAVYLYALKNPLITRIPVLYHLRSVRLDIGYHFYNMMRVLKHVAPNLRQVSAEFHEASDQMLQVLSEIPRLEILEARGSNKFTDYAMTKFLQAVPNLKQLSLHNCATLHGTFLATIGQYTPNLELLHVDKNMLFIDSMRKLPTEVFIGGGLMPKLKSINIGWQVLTKQLIEGLTKYYPNVEHFETCNSNTELELAIIQCCSIREFKVTANSTHEVLAAASRKQTLKRLTGSLIHLNKVLDHSWLYLTSVNFPFVCSIATTSTKQLYEPDFPEKLLVACPSLTEIDLPDIPYASFVKVLKDTKNWPFLTRLVLLGMKLENVKRQDMVGQLELENFNR